MLRRLLVTALLLSSLVLAQTKDDSSMSASPPAQAKSDSTEPPAQVTVGDGRLTGGHLIHKVQPKYPTAAKKAHIQGTVVFSATIGKDGTIQKLDPVSGPVELIPAATDAVLKWRYSPFLWKTDPITVTTDIRVKFSYR